MSHRLLRTFLPALLACFLCAVPAMADDVADDEQEDEQPPPPAPAAPVREVAPPPPAPPRAQVVPAPAPAVEAYDEDGDTFLKKRYKEQVNTVARKPLRHDLDYLESRDRTGWRGHTTWRGVRDERPLIARKTLGFHDPDPHRPRYERMLLVARGPIRGPAPSN